MSNRSYNWCFTLNNYNDEDIALIAHWPARFVVVGREVGKEGTPHLQGFVIMKNVARLSSMKKMQQAAHWEICKGSWEQNYDYCTKDGDFTEFGEKPKTKGQKGADEKLRWSEALTAAKEGRYNDIDVDIRMRYYKTCKEVHKDHMQKPKDADGTTGVWIWGPPGTGKSKSARKDYPGAYLKGQNKWWDGYQEEESVIMDDFDTGSLGHHLKIWADRYSFLAEVKGGALHIRPKNIVVTSNFAPDDPKFEWDSVTIEAIKRRFKVIHMVELYRL